VKVTANQLRNVRWDGSATFRSLSFPFSVRWNWAEAGDYVRYAFGAFEVPRASVSSLEPAMSEVFTLYSLVSFPRARSKRFRLLKDERLLAASDDPGGVFGFLAHHLNLETMRRAGDFLLIHAGAAVTPRGEGVLLPGASGSGKTSLTAGLVRSGFAYLSDEAGAIDPVTRRVYPYPKTLHLRPGVLERVSDDLTKSREYFPGSEERQVRAEDLRAGAVATEPSELRFVILPQFKRGAATTMTPITAAESVAELGRNAWNLSVYRARGLELLTDLCRKAQGRRLVFGDLDAGVEAVRNVCLGKDI
jgi:hypothetical protein